MDGSIDEVAPLGNVCCGIKSKPLRLLVCFLLRPLSANEELDLFKMLPSVFLQTRWKVTAYNGLWLPNTEKVGWGNTGGVRREVGSTFLRKRGLVWRQKPSTLKYWETDWQGEE